MCDAASDSDHGAHSARLQEAAVEQVVSGERKKLSIAGQTYFCSILLVQTLRFEVRIVLRREYRSNG